MKTDLFNQSIPEVEFLILDYNFPAYQPNVNEGAGNLTCEHLFDIIAKKEQKNYLLFLIIHF